MKKFTMKDLTPDFMKGLSMVDSAEKIIEFCKEKGYEITQELAEKLLDQVQKVNSLSGCELSDEALEAVAGGGSYI